MSQRALCALIALLTYTAVVIAQVENKGLRRAILVRSSNRVLSGPVVRLIHSALPPNSTTDTAALPSSTAIGTTGFAKLMKSLSMHYLTLAYPVSPAAKPLLPTPTGILESPFSLDSPCPKTQGIRGTWTFQISSRIMSGKLARPRRMIIRGCGLWRIRFVLLANVSFCMFKWIK